MLQSIAQRRQRFQSVVKRAQAVADLETQADLAKHICVLSCGTYEKSIVAIIEHFSRQRGAPELVAFIASRTRKSQNYTPDKLLGLLGEFNPSWRSQMDSFLDEERRDALNSLYNNRHQIAHGNTSTVSLANVLRWNSHLFDIIDEFLRLAQ